MAEHYLSDVQFLGAPSPAVAPVSPPDVAPVPPPVVAPVSPPDVASAPPPAVASQADTPVTQYLSDAQFLGTSPQTGSGGQTSNGGQTGRYLSDAQFLGTPKSKTPDGAFMYGIDQAQKLVGEGMQVIEDTFKTGTHYGGQLAARQRADIKAGGYQPKYPGTLADQKTIGDMAGWLGERSLELLPSVAPVIGGAAAAALTAPISAAAALVITGGTLLLSGTMGAGMAAQEMKAQGVYNPPVALAAGGVIMVLDRVGAGVMVPASAIVKIVGQGFKKEVATKLVEEAAKTGITRELVKRTLVGAASLVGQDATTVAAAASQGAKYDSTTLVKRAIDDLVLGAGMGAAVGGGSMAIEGIRAPRNARPAEENSLLTSSDRASAIADNMLQKGYADQNNLVLKSRGWTDAEINHMSPVKAAEVVTRNDPQFDTSTREAIDMIRLREKARQQEKDRTVKETQYYEQQAVVDITKRIGEDPYALVAKQLGVSRDQIPNAQALERLVGAAQKLQATETPAATRITTETGVAGGGVTGAGPFSPTAAPLSRGQRPDYAGHEATGRPQAPTDALRIRVTDSLTASGGGERPFIGAFEKGLTPEQQKYFTQRADQKTQAERTRLEEDLQARWDARARDEKSRKYQNEQTRAETAAGYKGEYTSDPGAPAADGFYQVDSKGNLTDPKGNIVQFPGHKAAAKWAATKGQGGYFDRVVTQSNSDTVWLRARPAYYAAKEAGVKAAEAGATRDTRRATEPPRGLPQPQAFVDAQDGILKMDPGTAITRKRIQELGGVKSARQIRGLMDQLVKQGLIEKSGTRWVTAGASKTGDGRVTVKDARAHLEKGGMTPKEAAARIKEIKGVAKTKGGARLYNIADLAPVDVGKPVTSPVGKDLLNIPDFLKRTPGDVKTPTPPAVPKEKIVSPEKKKRTGNIEALQKAKFNKAKDDIYVQADKQGINLTEDQLAKLATRHLEQKVPIADLVTSKFQQNGGDTPTWEGQSVAPDAQVLNHPENAGHRQEIQHQVTQLTRRITGKDVKIEVVDRMKGRDPGGPWKEVTGGLVRGKDNITYVSLKSLDILGTGRHEMIHFLKETGALKGARLKMLERQAKNWAKTLEIGGKYDHLSKAGRIEEIIADAAAANGRGELNARGIVGKTLQFIREFGQKLRNLVTSGEFVSARQTLDRIDAGSLAAAKTQSAGGDGATKFQRITPDTIRNAAYDRLREADKTVWDKVKKITRITLKRAFFPGGNLPTDTYEAKILKDRGDNLVEFDVKGIVGNFESAIKRRMSTMTKAEVATLDQTLRGNVPFDLQLPVKEAIFRMRQYIDNMSIKYREILFDEIKQLKEKGVPDAVLAAKIDLLNTLAANAGKYVHRSYRMFDDPKWFKKVPKGVYERATQYLTTERGMTASEAEKTITRILTEGTAYDSFESFIKESKLGAKDLSILKKRKDIAEPIRELMGEFKDPRLNFVRTATRMGKLIQNQLFLNRVKEQGMGTFLFEQKDIPQGVKMKKIATKGSQIMGPLDGLYTYPAIEQSFRDALGKEEAPNWLRAIIRVNGMVKYGKTILSPTTVARNYMSGFFFTTHSGHFNYSLAEPAFKAAKSYFAAKGGGGAYEREMIDLGVSYDSPYAGEAKDIWKDIKFEDTFLSGSTVGKGVRRANSFLMKVYQFGDDLPKMFGFESDLADLMKYKHGINKDSTSAEYATARNAEKHEAARRIRQTYPTYSMVGRSIKQLRRFPLVGAFVSFPAEIIRTQFGTMRLAAQDLADPQMRPAGLKRLAGIALTSSMFYAAVALSKVWIGISDKEEEAIRLGGAPWAENSNLLFIGRDEKGNPQMIDLSYLDPYAYFQKPITALLRGRPVDKAVVSAAGELLSPFFGKDIAAGTLMEIWKNKKATGGRVFNPADTGPSQLQDVAKYLTNSLQPGFVSLGERMAMAAAGVTTPNGREYKLREEMAAAIGWRVSTFDPIKSIMYRTFRFTDQLKNASGILNRVLRNQGDVSNADIQNALKTTQDARQAAYKDFELLVLAALKVGASKAQLRRVLRANKVPRIPANDLVNGRPMRPWKPKLSSIRGEMKSRRALGNIVGARELLRRWRMTR